MSYFLLQLFYVRNFTFNPIALNGLFRKYHYDLQVLACDPVCLSLQPACFRIVNVTPVADTAFGKSLAKRIHERIVCLAKGDKKRRDLHGLRGTQTMDPAKDRLYFFPAQI